MHFEMSMLGAVIMLPAGLAILIKGADLLVDGAVGLAERIGISPMVIGLTIVAMGTSAPEVASSITLVLDGNGDGAIGNVYGSNIANLMLIGGICSIIRPICVRSIVLKREIPVMLGVGLLLLPLLYNMHFGRFESILLLVLFAGMIYFTVVTGLKEAKDRPGNLQKIDDDIHEHTNHKQRSIKLSLIFVLLGLIGLAVGAKMSVASAVFLGKKAGMSDLVIGLSIIAVGTSLPELMTCLIAALKGHDDLSIGNLVGSNIFNTLLVIGVAGVVRPFDITDRGLIGLDYWIMIGAAVAFMLVAIVFKKINRLWGVIFSVSYFAFLIWRAVINRT